MRIDGLGTPFTGVVAIGAGGNTSSGIVAGRVRQAGNHYDDTTCLNAMDQPGAAPTTGVNPTPRPPAEPPNEECEKQLETPAATYGDVDSSNRAHRGKRTLNSKTIKLSPTANAPLHRGSQTTRLWFRHGQGAPSWRMVLRYLAPWVPEYGERNIIALFSQANRAPNGMRKYEQMVQQRLLDCEVVEYRVDANYTGTNLIADSVTITATGNKGFSLACRLENSTAPKCL
jgi:hypothetical protein